MFGVGLLFTGQSGIGKSECVLDLVERGHRLVADDLVIVTRRGNDMLIGRGHELQRHFMEIRGVGLVDIPAIFGIRAVRQQKRIEVVVQLEEWRHDAVVERTGLDGETTDILGVRLPRITVPLNPGKNITVIAEVIAMNHLLQYSGVDPAERFNERLIKQMREQVRDQPYLVKTMSEAIGRSARSSRGTATSPPDSSPRSSRSRAAATLLEPIQVQGLVRRGHRAAAARASAGDGRARDLHRPAGGKLHDGRAPAAARPAGRRARRRARTCRCCSTSCSCRRRPTPHDARACGGRTARSAIAVVRRAGVALELYRIDDRLIHGQVVVGWGQPLDLAFIVLVDDEVAASDWEQELYRMGVPPEMEVYFHSVDAKRRRCWSVPHRAAPGHPAHRRHRDHARARRLHGGVREVNVGGIHHRAGRTQHLRYVFLTPDEERALRDVAALGALVTAQDVPAARAVPLEEMLTNGEASIVRSSSCRSPCSAASSASTSSASRRR